MPIALEHIRRMRGGAQAHLMRCDDGYYVVKFQNNPQHVRILANEWLAARLAARLGVPAPAVAVIDVGAELVRYTAELVMQVGPGQTPCRPGLQFGSRYPGDPARVTVHDFLPDERLGEVRNLDDFLGALVLDKWCCNTNGRQAIFFADSILREDAAPRGYVAQFVDQGFCFNAGEWQFPDAPLRGLYFRHRVYDGVRGMDDFEPWLARLESRITGQALDDAAKEIPPEWLAADGSRGAGTGHDDLFRLLEQLYRRRTRVRDLILDAKNSSRQPFANWK